MEGFHVRFVQLDSTWMVLAREQGLTLEQLMPIEVRMLQANQIPQCIPVEFQEVDFQITLRYNLSNTRMLSQSLRGSTLSLPILYTLLLQVMTTLEDSVRHMLRPDHYIIHPDYIFIEGQVDLGTLWLCYVPVLDTVQSEPLHRKMSEFITYLMGSVSELSGAGIQRLLQYCQQAPFDVKGCKVLLLELLKTPDSTLKRSMPKIELYMEEAAAESSLPGNELPLHPERQMNGQNDPSSIHLNQDQRVECSRRYPNKYRTYFLFSGVLALVAIWKFIYFSFSEMEGSIYLCAGLSIEVMVLIYLVWRSFDFSSLGQRWLHRRNDLHAPSAVSSHTSADRSEHSLGLMDLHPPPVFTAEKLGSHLNLDDEADATRYSPAVVDLLETRQSHEHTVVLQPSAVGSSPVPSQIPFIERANPKQGTTERIRIDVSHFVIGRSEDIAHCIDSSPGVSRAHAEIFAAEGGYCIKDLGSRNGTQLQDERLVPYTPYTLADGARFRIAAMEYVFYLH